MSLRSNIIFFTNLSVFVWWRKYIACISILLRSYITKSQVFIIFILSYHARFIEIKNYHNRNIINLNHKLLNIVRFKCNDISALRIRNTYLHVKHFSYRITYFIVNIVAAFYVSFGKFIIALKIIMIHIHIAFYFDYFSLRIFKLSSFYYSYYFMQYMSDPNMYTRVFVYYWKIDRPAHLCITKNYHGVMFILIIYKRDWL